MLATLDPWCSRKEREATVREEKLLQGQWGEDFAPSSTTDMGIVIQLGLLLLDYYCLFFIYLKGRERSFFICGFTPQMATTGRAGPGQTIWASHVGAGARALWAIFCCSLKCACRELHPKWSSQNTSRHSYGMLTVLQEFV